MYAYSRRKDRTRDAGLDGNSLLEKDFDDDFEYEDNDEMVLLAFIIWIGFYQVTSYSHS